MAGETRFVALRGVGRPLSGAAVPGRARGAEQNAYLRLAILLYLVLLLDMLMPANLLVSWGIPYNIPGGFPLFKIHPASYILLLAMMLAGLQSTTRSQLWSIGLQFPVLWFYCATVAVIALITAWRFGISGVAFYIDTLLSPGLLAWLLLMQLRQTRLRLFYLLLGLMVLNSGLGLYESATAWRLLPYLIEGDVHEEDFFRSAALAAHPLESAGRTVPVLLVALLLTGPLRLAVMPVLLLSLLAFGSRSAFLATLLFMVLGTLRMMLDAIWFRAQSVQWGTLLLMVIIMGLGLGLGLSLDLGSRIIEKLYWDDSAASRVGSVMILGQMSIEQFLFGMGAKGVNELMGLHRGLYNIENFWVVWLIQLGVLQFLFLATALLALLYRMVRHAPSIVRYAALIFLLVASSNDALSNKTPNLSLLVFTLMGAAALPRPKTLTSQPSVLTPLRLGNRGLGQLRGRYRNGDEWVDD